MKTQSTQSKTMADLCQGDDHFWPHADLFYNGDERGSYRSFINDGGSFAWNMTPDEMKESLLDFNAIGGNE